MSDFGKGIAAIVSAVLVLAIIAVVVGRNSNTGSVISSAGSGLAQLIGMAVGSGSSVGGGALWTAANAAAAPFTGGTAVSSAAFSTAAPFLDPNVWK